MKRKELESLINTPAPVAERQYAGPQITAATHENRGSVERLIEGSKQTARQVIQDVNDHHNRRNQ